MAARRPAIERRASSPGHGPPPAVDTSLRRRTARALLRSTPPRPRPVVGRRLPSVARARRRLPPGSSSVASSDTAPHRRARREPGKQRAASAAVSAGTPSAEPHGASAGANSRSRGRPRARRRENGAEPVARSRGPIPGRRSVPGRQLSDPLHGLQEKGSLRVAGGARLEMRPVAARAGGVRAPTGPGGRGARRPGAPARIFVGPLTTFVVDVPRPAARRRRTRRRPRPSGDALSGGPAGASRPGGRWRPLSLLSGRYPPAASVAADRAFADRPPGQGPPGLFLGLGSIRAPAFASSCATSACRPPARVLGERFGQLVWQIRRSSRASDASISPGAAEPGGGERAQRRLERLPTGPGARGRPVETLARGPRAPPRRPAPPPARPSPRPTTVSARRSHAESTASRQ